METQDETGLVEAARSGDDRALDQLFREYLPLVYNVVGRALNGHDDVDDVVQEVMIRAAQELPTLRDVTRFRSWLIAICFRQVQTRYRVRARRSSREAPLEHFSDQAAPAGDFVEQTVLKLALSGQRREVVEATRWLSQDDRNLLALWWQEAAGVISRSELTEAAGLNRRHTSARIQRLKDRLETARIVQRVQQTGRGCPRLLGTMRTGGSSPGDRELNRLSRHVRHCEDCRRAARAFVPPESLLAGITLLPVPIALAHGLPGVLSSAAGAAPAGVASLLSVGASAAPTAAVHPAAAVRTLSALKPTVVVTGVATTGAALAIGFGVMYLPPGADHHPVIPRPTASAPAVAPTPGPGPTARPGPTATQIRRDEAYAMVYFTDSPGGQGTDSRMHLAVSSDGVDWTPLNENAPVLTAEAGTKSLRDPSVLRRPDGTFVVVAADVAGNDIYAHTGYVHAWTSPDLRTFTYHRLHLHTMPTHTWGPEAFYDPARKQYGITYSANRNGRDSIFVNYTSDFATVSAPQLYFDPGFSVQDATVVGADGDYRLFYRDNRDQSIHEARSGTLAPRSFDKGIQPGALLQGTSVGNPDVVQAIDGQHWWLWADSYVDKNQGRLYLWQTTNPDDPKTWTTVSMAAYSQPLNARAGGIVALTAAERTALVDRWGTPSWRRIKSYNYPDRLLRHQDEVARLDPYPFDPFANSQWQLVPGLAGRAGVSFESVDLPGQYLHDTSSGVVLAKDDGTAAFRSSATFVQVPGLADPRWTSFRSFTDPTKYLRHSQFRLRLDPITDELGRKDATFSVGY